MINNVICKSWNPECSIQYQMFFKKAVYIVQQIMSQVQSLLSNFTYKCAKELYRQGYMPTHKSLYELYGCRLILINLYVVGEVYPRTGLLILSLFSKDLPRVINSFPLTLLVTIIISNPHKKSRKIGNHKTYTQFLKATFILM